ncbi:MAG: hypothetical protein WA972_05795 [Rhodococcus qingshengii]
MATPLAEILSNRLVDTQRDTTPFIMRETYLEQSDELPSQVYELISNKAYLPRHKKLQRLYGDRVLLKVVEMCHGKDSTGKPIRLPAAYYAKITSLANWDRTLATVKKLLAAVRRATEVVAKLGADPAWFQWYVGVVYRHSEAQIASWLERATTAKRGSPPKLFAWLVAQERS